MRVGIYTYGMLRAVKTISYSEFRERFDELVDEVLSDQIWLKVTKGRRAFLVAPWDDRFLTEWTKVREMRR